LADDIVSIGRIEGPRSAADQVAHRIREAIRTGQLSPGARLKENRLSEQLGVSRIPIREALSRLEAEGLVKREPYRGAVVVSLTPEEVTEFYMLQSLVEGHAAKLATPRLSREDVAILRHLIHQIKQHVATGRHEELPPLHRQFHSTIYSRCGSAKLISWIEDLYSRLPRNLSPTVRFTEPVEEYTRIVDAMEAGDAELAGRLMSEHIQHGSRAKAEYYARLASGDGRS